jgi:hypothetical protein
MPWPSILPQPLEPNRRQLRISNGMPNILVAEIGLDGPGIDAIVGHLEPAGVPQHVRVHWEAELGAIAQPLGHLLKAVGRDRGLALGHEQVR